MKIVSFNIYKDNYLKNPMETSIPFSTETKNNFLNFDILIFNKKHGWPLEDNFKIIDKEILLGFLGV